MADVKTFKKGIKLRPESADPNLATSNEGQVYFAKSGGARSQGLWFSDGANWNQLLTSAGSGALIKYTLPSSTTTYTAISNSEDIIICQPQAGITLTITLPAASSSDSKLIRFVRKTNTGSVIIDGNSAETIDGQASLPFDAQYETLHLYCDGSEWFTLSSEVINIFDTTISNPNVTTSLSNIAYYTADRPFLLSEASVGILDIPDNVPGTLELDIKKGTNRGNATNSVFSTKPSLVLTKEEVTITTKSKASMSVNETPFFLLYLKNGANIAVWFYDSGNANWTSPISDLTTAFGITYDSIQVNVSSASSAEEIRNAIKARLDIGDGGVTTDIGGLPVNQLKFSALRAEEKPNTFLPDGATAHTPVGGNTLAAGHALMSDRDTLDSLTTSVQGTGVANSDSTNQVFDGTARYVAEGEVLKLELTSIPQGLSKYYIKVKGVR